MRLKQPSEWPSKRLRALVRQVSWRIGCVAVAAFSLIGCAMPGSCSLLSVREYDKAFTMRIEAELESAPKDAAWPVFATDAVNLRDQVRACKGGAG